ncbi:hypothetical protein [Kribbella sp. NPDC050470]|uniref:hypothetical protein n=1 Tax=unclassified Kribbella TaxID=2644121 RepID=UPI003798BF64
MSETTDATREAWRVEREIRARVTAEITAAVRAIETGKGSEQYQHGRDTMRDDVLLAIDSLTPGVEW